MHINYQELSSNLQLLVLKRQNNSYLNNFELKKYLRLLRNNDIRNEDINKEIKFVESTLKNHELTDGLVKKDNNWVSYQDILASLFPNELPIAIPIKEKLEDLIRKLESSDVPNKDNKISFLLEWAQIFSNNLEYYSYYYQELYIQSSLIELDFFAEKFFGWSLERRVN